MTKYGIYFFNLRKENGQIKSTDTMIGEVDMTSKAYAGLDVQQACEKRIKSELAAKNGLSFYEFDDVMNLRCLAIEENKNHVDSRIRDYICKHTSATPIKVSYNNDKKRTELLRDITVEDAYNEAQRYAGGKDSRRLHNYALREYQKEIVDKALRILKDKDEVLINLSTRGGKSFVSLELAKLAGAKNILILTPYPAAEGSFRGEIEEHEDFRGWTFYTKNEIKNDTKFEPLLNCVFLSFAIMDPSGEKEKIKNITDQVHFDIIICDETHTTSASYRSAEILSVIPHEKEIHLSGTPYNDLMSGRFGKDNTVTLDFIDLIKWDKAHDKSVGFPDLGLKFICNMKELNEKLGADYPDAFTDHTDFSFEKAFGDPKDHTHKRAKAFLQWIFKQGVFNEHKHYLVFVPSVAISKIATAVLKAMDTGFEIMGLNDEDIGSSYEKTINDFEARNDKTIIVTCAKCTTGVTLKRCDAIVLLKRVNSAETFVQTLFRCMTPFAGKTKADLYELDSEARYKVINEVVKVHGALNGKSDLQSCRELLDCIAIESWSGEKMEFETEVAEKFLKKVKSIPTYYNMEDVFDFSSLKLTKNEQLALLSHDFGKSDKAKAQYIVAQNENATGVKSKSYSSQKLEIQEIKNGHGEVSEKKVAQKVEQKLKQLLLNLDWEIILNDNRTFKDLLDNVPSSISGDEQLVAIYRKVLKANEHSLVNFIEEYWLSLEKGKDDPDLEMELVNKLSSLNGVDKRTPISLVNRMLDKLGATKYDGSYILDPCVGTGTMLFAAHKRGWPKDHLIGTDTEPRFVQILNRLGYKNVFVKNCLDDDYNDFIESVKENG